MSADKCPIEGCAKTYPHLHPDNHPIAPSECRQCVRENEVCSGCLIKKRMAADERGAKEARRAYILEGAATKKASIIAYMKFQVDSVGTNGLCTKAFRHMIEMLERDDDELRLPNVPPKC